MVGAGGRCDATDPSSREEVPPRSARRPLFIGQRRRDGLTIWFSCPAVPPVAGPWELTLLIGTD